jgi:general secretion pathway protein F
VINVRYRAYDSRSNVQEGTIAAATEQAAIDALYELGLTPYETQSVGQRRSGTTSRQQLAAKPDNGKSLRSGVDRVGLKELTAFTAELASLATSGVALDDALRIISGAGSSRSIARLGAGILDEMLSGSQLSEALDRRAVVFAADYRAIVRAGETAGATGQALTQIADLLSRRLEIRRKIAAALVYPMILLGMSVLSVGVIVAFLLPSLAPIFTDANRPLPPILAALMELQDNWLTLLLVAAGAMVATALALQVIKRNHVALQTVDRIKVAMPLAGELVRMRDASRFTRALGTLLTAGVPLLASLKTARDLVSNRCLAARYDAAIERVPEGLAVHLAFEPSGLIPTSALRLVTIGEETGQLGTMLLRAAGLIENDHLRRVERMLGLLTPLLTLAIGGAVASLIMTVMSAVLSINDLAFQ